ncbi:hypothetical protein M513_04728 [Trichuris suis]|uniref:Galectin domain-containing protein n=2 Tax=Trichuris suis TaxID=68888 RepID=A0A085MAY9_9BILA|nr:hypothetical protein M513_04728 [Trichuris suis]
MESNRALFRLLIVLTATACLADYDTSLSPFKIPFKRAGPSQNLVLEFSLKPGASKIIIDINSDCTVVWRLEGNLRSKTWTTKSLVDNDWQNEKWAKMKLRSPPLSNTTIKATVRVEPRRIMATIGRQKLEDVNNFPDKSLTHFIVKGDVILHRTQQPSSVREVEEYQNGLPTAWDDVLKYNRQPIYEASPKSSQYPESRGEMPSGTATTITTTMKLPDEARSVHVNFNKDGRTTRRFTVNLRDKTWTLSKFDNGVWKKEAQMGTNGAPIDGKQMNITAVLDDDLVQFYINGHKVSPKYSLPKSEVTMITAGGNLDSYEISIENPLSEIDKDAPVKGKKSMATAEADPEEPSRTLKDTLAPSRTRDKVSRTLHYLSARVRLRPDATKMSMLVTMDGDTAWNTDVDVNDKLWTFSSLINGQWTNQVQFRHRIPLTSANEFLLNTTVQNGLAQMSLNGETISPQYRLPGKIVKNVTVTGDVEKCTVNVVHLKRIIKLHEYDPETLEEPVKAPTTEQAWSEQENYKQGKKISVALRRIQASVKLIDRPKYFYMIVKMENDKEWKLDAQLDVKEWAFSQLINEEWKRRVPFAYELPKRYYDNITITVLVRDKKAQVFVGGKAVSPKYQIPGVRVKNVTVAGDIVSAVVRVAHVKRVLLPTYVFNEQEGETDSDDVKEPTEETKEQVSPPRLYDKELPHPTEQGPLRFILSTVQLKPEPQKFYLIVHMDNNTAWKINVNMKTKTWTPKTLVNNVWEQQEDSFQYNVPLDDERTFNLLAKVKDRKINLWMNRRKISPTYTLPAKHAKKILIGGDVQAFIINALHDRILPTPSEAITADPENKRRIDPFVRTITSTGRLKDKEDPARYPEFTPWPSSQRSQTLPKTATANVALKKNAQNFRVDLTMGPRATLRLDAPLRRPWKLSQLINGDEKKVIRFKPDLRVTDLRNIPLTFTMDNGDVQLSVNGRDISKKFPLPGNHIERVDVSGDVDSYSVDTEDPQTEQPAVSEKEVDDEELPEKEKNIEKTDIEISEEDEDDVKQVSHPLKKGPLRLIHATVQLQPDPSKFYMILHMDNNTAWKLNANMKTKEWTPMTRVNDVWEQQEDSFKSKLPLDDKRTFNLLAKVRDRKVQLWSNKKRISPTYTLPGKRANKILIGGDVQAFVINALHDRIPPKPTGAVSADPEKKRRIDPYVRTITKSGPLTDNRDLRRYPEFLPWSGSERIKTLPKTATANVALRRNPQNFRVDLKMGPRATLRLDAPLRGLWKLSQLINGDEKKVIRFKPDLRVTDLRNIPLTFTMDNGDVQLSVNGRDISKKFPLPGNHIERVDVSGDVDSYSVDTEDPQTEQPAVSEKEVDDEELPEKEKNIEKTDIEISEEDEDDVKQVSHPLKKGPLRLIHATVQLQPDPSKFYMILHMDNNTAPPKPTGAVSADPEKKRRIDPYVRTITKSGPLTDNTDLHRYPQFTPWTSKEGTQMLPKTATANVAPKKNAQSFRVDLKMGPRATLRLDAPLGRPWKLSHLINGEEKKVIRFKPDLRVTDLRNIPLTFTMDNGDVQLSVNGRDISKKFPLPGNHIERVDVSGDVDSYSVDTEYPQTEQPAASRKEVDDEEVPETVMIIEDTETEGNKDDADDVKLQPDPSKFYMIVDMDNNTAWKINVDTKTEEWTPMTRVNNVWEQQEDSFKSKLPLDDNRTFNLLAKVRDRKVQLWSNKKRISPTYTLPGKRANKILIGGDVQAFVINALHDRIPPKPTGAVSADPEKKRRIDPYVRTITKSGPLTDNRDLRRYPEFLPWSGSERIKTLPKTATANVALRRNPQNFRVDLKMGPRATLRLDAPLRGLWKLSQLINGDEKKVIRFKPDLRVTDLRNIPLTFTMDNGDVQLSVNGRDISKKFPLPGNHIEGIDISGDVDSYSVDAEYPQTDQRVLSEEEVEDDEQVPEKEKNVEDTDIEISEEDEDDVKQVSHPLKKGPLRLIHATVQLQPDPSKFYMILHMDNNTAWKLNANMKTKEWTPMTRVNDVWEQQEDSFKSKLPLDDKRTFNLLAKVRDRKVQLWSNKKRISPTYTLPGKRANKILIGGDVQAFIINALHDRILSTPSGPVSADPEKKRRIDPYVRTIIKSGPLTDKGALRRHPEFTPWTSKQGTQMLPKTATANVALKKNAQKFRVDVKMGPRATLRLDAPLRRPFRNLISCMKKAVQYFQWKLSQLINGDEKKVTQFKPDLRVTDLRNIPLTFTMDNGDVQLSVNERDISKKFPLPGNHIEGIDVSGDVDSYSVDTEYSATEEPAISKTEVEDEEVPEKEKNIEKTDIEISEEDEDDVKQLSYPFKKGPLRLIHAAVQLEPKPSKFYMIIHMDNNTAWKIAVKLNRMPCSGAPKVCQRSNEWTPSTFVGNVWEQQDSFQSKPYIGGERNFSLVVSVKDRTVQLWLNKTRLSPTYPLPGDSAKKIVIGGDVQGFVMNVLHHRIHLTRSGPARILQENKKTMDPYVRSTIKSGEVTDEGDFGQYAESSPWLSKKRTLAAPKRATANVALRKNAQSFRVDLKMGPRATLRLDAPLGRPWKLSQLINGDEKKVTQFKPDLRVTDLRNIPLTFTMDNGDVQLSVKGRNISKKFPLPGNHIERVDVTGDVYGYSLDMDLPISNQTAPSDEDVETGAEDGHAKKIGRRSTPMTDGESEENAKGQTEEKSPKYQSALRKIIMKIKLKLEARSFVVRMLQESGKAWQLDVDLPTQTCRVSSLDGGIWKKHPSFKPHVPLLAGQEFNLTGNIINGLIQLSVDGRVISPWYSLPGKAVKKITTGGGIEKYTSRVIHTNHPSALCEDAPEWSKEDPYMIDKGAERFETKKRPYMLAKAELTLRPKGRYIYIRVPMERNTEWMITADAKTNKWTCSSMINGERQKEVSYQSAQPLEYGKRFPLQIYVKAGIGQVGLNMDKPFADKYALPGRSVKGIMITGDVDIHHLNARNYPRGKTDSVVLPSWRPTIHTEDIVTETKDHWEENKNYTNECSESIQRIMERMSDSPSAGMIIMTTKLNPNAKEFRVIVEMDEKNKGWLLDAQLPERKWVLKTVNNGEQEEVGTYISKTPIRKDGRILLVALIHNGYVKFIIDDVSVPLKCQLSATIVRDVTALGDIESFKPTVVYWKNSKSPQRYDDGSFIQKEIEPEDLIINAGSPSSALGRFKLTEILEASKTSPKKGEQRKLRDMQSIHATVRLKPNAQTFAVQIKLDDGTKWKAAANVQTRKWTISSFVNERWIEDLTFRSREPLTRGATFKLIVIIDIYTIQILINGQAISPKCRLLGQSAKQVTISGDVDMRTIRSVYWNILAEPDVRLEAFEPQQQSPGSVIQTVYGEIMKGKHEYFYTKVGTTTRTGHCSLSTLHALRMLGAFMKPRGMSNSRRPEQLEWQIQILMKLMPGAVKFGVTIKMDIDVLWQLDANVKTNVSSAVRFIYASYSRNGFLQEWILSSRINGTETNKVPFKNPVPLSVGKRFLLTVFIGSGESGVMLNNKKISPVYIVPGRSLGRVVVTGDVIAYYIRSTQLRRHPLTSTKSDYLYGYVLKWETLKRIHDTPIEEEKRKRSLKVEGEYVDITESKILLFTRILLKKVRKTFTVDFIMKGRNKLRLLVTVPTNEWKFSTYKENSWTTEATYDYPLPLICENRAIDLIFVIEKGYLLMQNQKSFPKVPLPGKLFYGIRISGDFAQYKLQTAIAEKGSYLVNAYAKRAKNGAFKMVYFRRERIVGPTVSTKYEDEESYWSVYALKEKPLPHSVSLRDIEGVQYLYLRLKFKPGAKTLSLKLFSGSTLVWELVASKAYKKYSKAGATLLPSQIPASPNAVLPMFLIIQESSVTVIYNDEIQTTNKIRPKAHVDRAVIDGDVVLYQMKAGNQKSIMKNVPKEERKILLYYYQLSKMKKQGEAKTLLEMIIYVLKRERGKRIKLKPIDLPHYIAFKRNVEANFVLLKLAFKRDAKAVSVDFMIDKEVILRIQGSLAKNSPNAQNEHELELREKRVDTMLIRETENKVFDVLIILYKSRIYVREHLPFGAYSFTTKRTVLADHLRRNTASLRSSWRKTPCKQNKNKW